MSYKKSTVDPYLLSRWHRRYHFDIRMGYRHRLKQVLRSSRNFTYWHLIIFWITTGSANMPPREKIISTIAADTSLKVDTTNKKKVPSCKQHFYRQWFFSFRKHRSPVLFHQKPLPGNELQGSHNRLTAAMQQKIFASSIAASKRQATTPISLQHKNYQLHQPR